MDWVQRGRCVRRIGLALSSSSIVRVAPRHERETRLWRHRKTGKTKRRGLRGSGRPRRRLDEAFSPWVLSHFQLACALTLSLSGPQAQAACPLHSRSRECRRSEAPAIGPSFSWLWPRVPAVTLQPMPAAAVPRARETAWPCGIFLIGLVVHSSPASLRLVGSSGTPDRRRTQGADEVELRQCGEPFCRHVTTGRLKSRSDRR